MSQVIRKLLAKWTWGDPRVPHGVPPGGEKDIQMSCLGGPQAKEGSQMQISKEQT